jgi:hypothetical protein
MTTASTVGFRADPYCWALSSFLWSCWSLSRPPRNWVSSARCSEGFASDFVIATMAATIIIAPGDISRVIADACASRAVIATAAAVVVEAAVAAVRAAADSSAKAGFSGGRVAA